MADRHAVAAGKPCQRLKDAGIRAEADESNEKLGYRIREAELQKIEYVAVIGDKEASADSVLLRVRGKAEQRVCGVEELIAELQSAAGAPLA
ncbi:His/Gly/Thr/Pro-type tRNA ligase C-terminal domain-containing protein [Paenibacillus sp. 2RAB27]|uniref:His/Gly/Thr/Pro-type tRNA ligase C-terminal domain-containing protein n=1 Tax=Paenibacillus sp. 2RAB27 TaxID=3232991 RepID=UPI003F96461F